MDSEGILQFECGAEALPQQDACQDLAEKAHEAYFSLLSGKSSTPRFDGWLSLPGDAKTSNIAQEVNALARELVAYEAVVVIGIGGSYLGALALAEALEDQKVKPHTEIVFLGFTLCADYMAMQLDRLKERRYAVVVISKSGTTTEPALAFRYVLTAMKKSALGYQPERVVAITDAARGTLHDLAEREGIRRMVIPDDVGGRYSVLTPVGLLPLAIAGVDIDALLEGARRALEEQTNPHSAAVEYAIWRNRWYRNGRKLEVLALYSPFMRSIGEWYKQLYGESEGKQGSGVFPVSVCNTTDLHSLGQYLQEGERLFMETHVLFSESQQALPVPALEGIADGLEYLVGRSLHEVNLAAAQATFLAHEKSGIPSATLRLARRDAFSLGYLLYFWELSCALGVLMQGHNPFDQPGVEAYKKNMFHLLGKPGF
ncbi:MAG: glucose-6-phosphate isomerase [Bacteroides sp.]